MIQRKFLDAMYRRLHEVEGMRAAHERNLREAGSARLREVAQLKAKGLKPPKQAHVCDHDGAVLENWFCAINNTINDYLRLHQQAKPDEGAAS